MSRLWSRTVALAIAAAVLGLTTSLRAEDAKKPEKKQLTGEITAVDTAAGTVSINSKKAGVQTFTINAATKFGGEGGDKGITIADLKVGDKITVHYTEADGKKIAAKVGKVDADKEARKEKKKQGQ